MKLSIIVVSWNVKDLLRKCLASIAIHAPGVAYEIIVIDNASFDGSVDMVCAEFGNVRLITNAENRGFAAACNQGITASKGEYLFFLNPDSEVTDTTFNAAIDFFETHSGAGIVGSHIINEDGSLQESVKSFPKPFQQLLMMAKIHHLFPDAALFKEYFVRGMDYAKTQQVDQPIGAALWARRKCLEKVGIFDERFFIWFEEVDLCKRAHDAGWEIWYIAESTVIHHGARSFKQQNWIQRQINTYTSCGKYLRKHFGLTGWFTSVIMGIYTTLFKLLHLGSGHYGILWKTGAAVAVLEILSFAAYFFPILGQFGFFFIVILTFIISFYKLEYGISIAAAELIIGSKGHLFFLQVDTILIGVRIGIFCALLAAWLIKKIQHCVKEKRFAPVSISKSFFWWYCALAIIIVGGIIIGINNGNQLSIIFQDVNAWFYFVFAIIVNDALGHRERWNTFLKVIIGALVARIITIFALFYIMGHKGFGLDVLRAVYRWVRTTGLAEITQFDHNISRVFFQSQIYDVAALVVLVVVSMAAARIMIDRKERIASFIVQYKSMVLFGSGVIASLIVSFSRTYWLAGFIGLACFALIGVRQYSFKAFLLAMRTGVIALFIALLFLGTLSRLPFPPTEGGFSLDALADRMSNLENEAAAASRWNLLPVLINTVKEQPFVGHGFGKTVTYVSKDPRVLEYNANGIFTTYAFEWGYLDIAVKLGLLGLIVYVAFLAMLLTRGWRLASLLDMRLRKGSVALGLWGALIVLMVAHMFSPYLNHPLGIAFVVMYARYIEVFSKSA